MARNPKSTNALQSFRGGRNRLGVWAKHAEGECCQPGVVLDIDRLPPTVQWENANIHTSPLGGRNPTWRFGELQSGDKEAIIDHINAVGVGAIIELQAIPTFAFVTGVSVSTFAEEVGLAFEVITRNGTPLPADQVILVEEQDAGGCGETTRTRVTTTDVGGNVLDTGDLGAVGTLDGATRSYTIAVSGAGEFALEADVIALRVTSVPAGGVAGHFDLAVDLSYVSTTRSFAA